MIKVNLTNEILKYITEIDKNKFQDNIVWAVLRTQSSFIKMLTA